MRIIAGKIEYTYPHSTVHNHATVIIYTYEIEVIRSKYILMKEVPHKPVLKECKRHCPCYIVMIETRRDGAKKTNKNYSNEKRKQAWLKRKNKVQTVA